MQSLNFFAQELTYDDFKSIIPFLKTEDYKGAFNRSQELLNSTKSDTSDIRAQISYMSIYSSAGMVTLEQMSNPEDFIGNTVRCGGILESF